MHAIELIERDPAVLRLAKKALEQQAGIMEFGVSRDYGSSAVLARLGIETGSRLLLVDPNGATLDRASEELRGCIEHVALASPGEDVEVGHFEGVGVFHLDGFDIVTRHPHKESTIDAYREIGIDLLRDGNVLSALSHHLIAEKVLQGIGENRALVLLDDTRCTLAGQWMGKGATAVPFLLANGFSLVSSQSAPLWQWKRYKWGVALYRPGRVER